MKIGVAIAGENALPSAFVVFRGAEQGIHQAAEMGYDGIELAVRDGNEFKPEYIRNLLSKNKIEIAAVSTGQFFADKKLWLSAKDSVMREKAVREFCGIVDMAADLGCSVVNIGRARGFVEQNDTIDETEKRFSGSIETVSKRASDNNINIVLESVNRYEINYINSVGEGAALLKKLNIPNLLLMPDVFHMNIEDASIEQSITENAGLIGYVHFADSNRLAPGWGHLDFASIAGALKKAGYDKWVTAEILPEPSPREAAKQAIDYLKKIYKNIK